MTISVNSKTHNRILDIDANIAVATHPLRDLNAPPTPGMVRETIARLRKFTHDLENVLVQPERLTGCKCALPGYEDHAGPCSGPDCYCH